MVPVPRPDYSATPSKVFQDLTASIIIAHGDLDVLFLARGGKPSQFNGMPTWSVYEDSGLAENPLNPWRVFSQPELIANKPDPEIHATANSRSAARFSKSSDMVTLCGFIVDLVDGLGSWEKFVQGQRQFWPCKEPVYQKTAYVSDEEVFSAVWNTLVCGLQSVPSIAAAPKVFGEVMLKTTRDVERELLLGQQCQTTNDATEIVFKGWYHQDRGMLRSWFDVGRNHGRFGEGRISTARL